MMHFGNGDKPNVVDRWITERRQGRHEY